MKYDIYAISTFVGYDWHNHHDNIDPNNARHKLTYYELFESSLIIVEMKMTSLSVSELVVAWAAAYVSVENDAWVTSYDWFVIAVVLTVAVVWALDWSYGWAAVATWLIAAASVVEA